MPDRQLTPQVPRGGSEPHIYRGEAELQLLDFRQLSLVDAHRALGEAVRAQVHKMLLQQVEAIDKSRLGGMLSQVRDCRASLEQRSQDPALPARLRSALGEYRDCLEAWAEGCELGACQHAYLQEVTPLERALLLQYDESGCQTGAYRQADGGVILWHTEESVEKTPGDGFDALRLVSLRVAGAAGPVDVHAFIYPNLLPGPAFGWRTDGYAQAVDTLHTRPFSGPIGGTLANAACWITLRLGAEMNARELLSALRPFYTGYALNIMHRQGVQVLAHKHEFAGDQLTSAWLGEQPGSYLFQANIFSDPRGGAARAMEAMPRPKWRLYRQRAYRTRRFLHEKANSASPGEDMAFFYKMISSHAGGSWAYANPDVKAHFIQRLSAQGVETWLGAGPARKLEV